MVRVGVRELKNRLSYYLARVREGEAITVTERGKEVAVIRPAQAPDEQRGLAGLRDAGVIRWGGGKPTVPARPVRGRGRPVSDYVLEDRR